MLLGHLSSILSMTAVATGALGGRPLTLSVFQVMNKQLPKPNPHFSFFRGGPLTSSALQARSKELSTPLCLSTWAQEITDQQSASNARQGAAWFWRNAWMTNSLSARGDAPHLGRASKSREGLLLAQHRVAAAGRCGQQCGCLAEGHGGHLDHGGFARACREDAFAYSKC